MAYILRLNGKHLKELDGKRIKHLIYKGTVYDLSYQKLNTPIIFLSDTAETYSSTAILGKAILGRAILGTVGVELNILATPVIYLDTNGTETPTLEQLDTPVIYLDNTGIVRLTTPVIYLETENVVEPEVPEEPVTTYTFKLNPNPSNAAVVLTTEGYTQIDNTIKVKEGNEVTWEVSLEGYITQTGSMVINSHVTKNVYLDLVPLKLDTPNIYLETIDSDVSKLDTPNIYLENMVLSTPEIYLETL